MDKINALQKLLNGTATEADVELLKRLLASGEISIGGNVNQSVIIIGSGNTVELPPAALDQLNARPMLGHLDRNLTGEEIASGLRRLDKLLLNRAPVLLPHYKEQVGRLRPTLKTEIKAISESARRERLEALAGINSICIEALDISFNGLALGEEAPKYDARSPFRGLESFRPEDSEFFFGREALTQKLVGKIKAHSFLAVLGASGSGKSSLVLAGVIPALDSDYAIFRPGTNPLSELESARGKTLIVVDQFEELFTLTCDESIRKDFIARMLDESTRARIILTLRSDFLGEVGAYRTLSTEIQNHMEIVPPMDMDELGRAMEGQAGIVDLRFEADLNQQILEDVADEPGAMPLLQHALWELWNRRHGRNLRASEYRAFGGVKQAITSTAEKVYADCSKPEQEALRDIFLRLTRLDDGDEGRDTRRRVPLGDLIPSGHDTASITLLLDNLANARLVVKTVNDAKTEVEVAHEALIRHWERLRLWLSEDRDALRLRESVSEDARRWGNARRDDALLIHRGGRLDDALEIRKNSRYVLTEIERAYLNECVALRNREQRERERRLRFTVIASIVASVIFIVLGSFGLVKSNEATSQAATAQANANIALSRQISAQAQSLFETGNLKQPTAVLLAIQSMRLFPTSDAAQILRINTLAHPISSLTHDKSVFFVAFSSNGEYVVSGSSDMTAKVWEVATGKEVARMIHDSYVYSVAFSPDGKYVVSGSGDKTARVWEATTGKEIARMTHDNSVNSVAFSPDGKNVASGSNDGTARVWEATTGKEIARIDLKSFTSVTSIAFSPNGRYVVISVVSGVCEGKDANFICNQGIALVWDAATGKEIVRMTYERYVNSVAFSPDGRYVVSGGCDKEDDKFLCTQGSARVWEATTGKEITRVTIDSNVNSVAFSLDGKMVVSGGGDNIVRTWIPATGQEIARMVHQDKIDSVAFSLDSKYVVSGSDDGAARVWEAATGQEITGITHNDVVRTVAFSPNGKYVVSGSDDGTIFVWESGKGKEINNFTNNGAVITAVFSPDSKYVATGSDDGTARIWEAATGKEIARIIYDDWVYAVVFSPDGKYLISGSIDGTARVWEVVRGKEIAHMAHVSDVKSVVFSPDGKYVASSGCDQQNSYNLCSLSSVRVWEATTGQELSRMIHDYYLQNGIINSIAFSPNGKYIVSGSSDNNVRIWDVYTGKKVSQMMHDGPVSSIIYSPDSMLIASGSYDKTVRVWQVATGKEVARMIHDSYVNSVAFSPDGKYVISGSSDKTARVWEATSGKEIARMIHDSSVNFVAFSPDGKYVASGSNDNTARVWEATTGKEIGRISHNDQVTSVAFSPDGRYIVSGSSDRTAHVWMWRPDNLIDDACSRITHNLTRAEWDQYIGDALPYQAVCPNLPIETESTPVP